MHNRSRGLIAAVAAALLVPVPILLDEPTGVARAGGALLLVLVLPGYSLSMLLAPESQSSWWVRIPFTVGLSMAATVAGGLALNLTPWGLTTESWVAWLSGLTLAVGGLALTRLRPRPEAVPVTGKTVRRDVALFALAATVAVSAVLVAYVGTLQRSEADSTQLWILPDEQAGSNEIRLGIRSLEPATRNYRLRVSSGDWVLGDWPSIALTPGQLWEFALVLPPDSRLPETVDALLYVSGSDTVYRRAALRQVAQVARP